MSARLRVPARVVAQIQASDAAARPGTDPLADELLARLRAGRVYADRSVGVTLTEDTLAVLGEYADTMWAAARDDAGFDADARADMNAAAACLRRIGRASDHPAGDALVEYRVRWEIDIAAGSPEEAARKALAVHRNPESTATVFVIVAPDGRETTVDLDDPVGQAP